MGLVIVAIGQMGLAIVAMVVGLCVGKAARIRAMGPINDCLPALGVVDISTAGR